jgi:hypothetical protein
LKELKRSPAVLVKCGDLAIDGEVFALQRFEGVYQDRVIVVKQRSVAREEPKLFARFEGERTVAVEFHFVEPIPGGQLPNWERHHWLDEIDRGFLFHPN